MTTQSKIILEAGKSYKCRNGKIITLRQSYRADDWLQSSEVYVYSTNPITGWKVFPLDNYPHPYDIVDSAITEE